MESMILTFSTLGYKIDVGENARMSQSGREKLEVRILL